MDKHPVIVGIDFYGTCARALKEAFRISTSRGESLLAFHVIDSRVLESIEERIKVDEDGLVAETDRRLQQFVREHLGDADGSVKVRSVIGHPFSELLKTVKEADAEVLVLGSHGSESDPKRVGSIAGKCVRKIPAEVLLVRDRQDGPFRHIVSCVDFSDTSRKAARRALEIAKQDGARLEFLYVHEPLPEYAVAGHYAEVFWSPYSEEEVIKHLRGNLESFVEDVIGDEKEVPHTITVETNTSVGRGIIDFVNHCGADLLVLGTRGRTGLKILLLGTTAEKVIHYSSCSTLAIKPDGFHYGD